VPPFELAAEQRLGGPGKLADCREAVDEMADVGLVARCDGNVVDEGRAQSSLRRRDFERPVARGLALADDR
jgi:hypothetical protein